MQGALAHEFEDMRLTERAAERFAGETYLDGGVLLGFAIACCQQVDGTALLVGDAQLLVDRFGRRAGLDGGERALCWGFGFHRFSLPRSLVRGGTHSQDRRTFQISRRPCPALSRRRLRRCRRYRRPPNL